MTCKPRSALSPGENQEASRGTPVRGERGQRRETEILAAAERLLRRGRLEDLTVRDVVREAQASVGSFYHLFGSKEGLLVPLYARYDERVTRGAAQSLESERWAGRDLAFRVSRLVRYSIYLYRSEGGLIRALALHARDHAAEVRDEQRERRRALYDRVAQLLLECRDEIGHPDPVSAVPLGIFFVAAACRDKILFPDAPHPHALECHDHQLARELTSAFLTYVQWTPHPKGADQ